MRDPDPPEPARLFDAPRASRPRAVVDDTPLAHARPESWRNEPAYIPVVAPAHEVSFARELEAPRPAGLTAYEAYAAKERALCAIIEAMPAIECWALHRRLTLARKDDAVARAFARLSGQRRARLLAFLADARRREATGSGR